MCAFDPPFCHILPFFVTNPPTYANPTIAVNALSTAKVHVIVAHPACEFTNPPQSGPTFVISIEDIHLQDCRNKPARQPPANAILNNPYADAYAPCFP